MSAGASPPAGAPVLAGAVREALRGLLPPAAAALVAVSGGPDSVALLHLCRTARPDLRLTVVHVRHGLRADAADAAAAAAHAAALSLPFEEVAAALDRRAGAAGNGAAGNGAAGNEAAARDARYKAIAVVADRLGVRDVLLGHTADDQAETVLLRAARGTGVAGLASMATVAHRGCLRLLRPLLELRRDAVRATVVGRATVQDPSNADPGQPRARTRHAVLPALAALAGPGGDAVPALARLAGLARQDDEALQSWADRIVAAHARAWGPAWWLPPTAVADLPRAVHTRVLRRLLQRAGAAAPPDHATLERLVALPPGGVLDVAGGLRVTASAAGLAAVARGRAGLTERRVTPGRATVLPELGLLLEAVPAGPAARADAPPHAGAWPGPPLPWRALVPVGAEPLRIRGRRPGDRLADGRVLKPLLEAVPRAVRDLVPLVVDSDDAVWWVPGLAVPPTAPATPTLALTLTSGPPPAHP